LRKRRERVEMLDERIALILDALVCRFVGEVCEKGKTIGSEEAALNGVDTANDGAQEAEGTKTEVVKIGGVGGNFNEETKETTLTSGNLNFGIIRYIEREDTEKTRDEGGGDGGFIEEIDGDANAIKTIEVFTAIGKVGTSVDFI
jgi:hypothetical protein